MTVQWSHLTTVIAARSGLPSRLTVRSILAFNDEPIVGVISTVERGDAIELIAKVQPFEWGGGVHEIGSSQFSEYRRAYYIPAVFATQPLFKPQVPDSLHIT